jgi:nucleotide-binding universal stress UspA family protein
MKNVLVAVDGSENSRRAVQFVRDFCRDYGPIVIHVLNVEPAPQAWQTHGMEQEAIEEHLRSRAAQVTEKSVRPLKDAGLEFEALFELGEPAQVIAQVAARLGCDAIVMGTRGLGTIRGMVLGSVSTKLLHLTELPVVLIR